MDADLSGWSTWGASSTTWTLITHPATLVTSLILITVASYHEILGYWFTGADAFTLIESSRIQGSDELLEPLVSPLMDGTAFVASDNLFFRPLVTYSFAIEHALWGMDPLGYHVTDLVLHTGAVILLYLFVGHLPGGTKGRAWMAAAIFALHPLVAENVPGIARRQDPMAVLFFLASWTAFLRYHDGQDRGRGWLVASIAALILAMASKEIAMLLPGVLVLHTALGVGGDLIDRVATGLRAARWHLVAALGFFVWRGVVLQGLGGYSRGANFPDRPVAEAMLAIVLEAARFLVYPFQMAHGQLELPLFAQAGIWTVILVGLGGLILTIYRGNLGDLRGDVKGYLSSPEGGVTVLMATWLATMTGLYAVTLIFRPWVSYPLVPPFAVLLTYLLARAVQASRPVVDRWTGTSRGEIEPTAWVGLAGTVILGSLVLSLVLASPLAHPQGYQEWETSGEVNQMILTGISEKVGEEEGSFELEAFRIPKGIQDHKVSQPHVLSASYLMDHSIQAYLDLDHGSDKVSDVSADKRYNLKQTPTDIRVRTHRADAGTFQVQIVYEGG